MLRFILRRALLAVLTLWLISVMTFGLFYAIPSDPARVLCGERCTEQQLENTRTVLGLDEPVPVQYLDFMGGIFVDRTMGEGDFAEVCPAPCLGKSFLTKEFVTDIVKRAFPVSASVAIGAWILQTFIAVGLGVIAARKRGTLLDKISIGSTLVGAALPIYFVGAMMLLIFRYTLEWLPQPHYTSFFENPLDWAGGMIMPWFTIAVIGFAFDARMTRSQMLETLDEDFIRTSRAKGLKDRVVYWRHALRASITPIATSAGVGLGALLSGAVVTETVFGLNGLGKLSVDAVTGRNLPIVMATVLITATFIVISTAVVDLMYAVIDPRVRLS